MDMFDSNCLNQNNKDCVYEREGLYCAFDMPKLFVLNNKYA